MLVADLHRRREPAAAHHRADLTPTLRHRRRGLTSDGVNRSPGRQIGRRDHTGQIGAGRVEADRRPSSTPTIVVDNADAGIGVPASTGGDHQHLGAVGGPREAPHHQHRRRQHQPDGSGQERQRTDRRGPDGPLITC